MRHPSPLIAPVLLSAVALFQIYAARTAWLTPWKGGGFGMFSTVDSPGVRFLRIVLQTDRGVVRVAVPARFQREAAQLREAPNEKSLSVLVKQLGAGTWVPNEAISPEASYAAMMASVSSRSGHVAPHSAETRSGYRMLGPGESPREPHLDVQVVCAEVWRYRVERGTTRVVADRLMQECSAAR
jgi:hypothetical protein